MCDVVLRRLYAVNSIRRMMFTEEVIQARLLLGSRVKLLRKGQRLTQEQLGSMVGIDRTCISRLESGRVNATFDTLMRLSSGFGLTLSELLMGVEASSQAARDSLPLIFSLSEMQVMVFKAPKDAGRSTPQA